MPSDYDRLTMAVASVPLPTAGHVLFGPGHFTPARDHTYSIRPDATGLYKPILGRKPRRTCDCRVKQGTLFVCEPCSRFGLDHLPLAGFKDETAGAEPTDRADIENKTAAAVGVGTLKGGKGA